MASETPAADYRMSLTEEVIALPASESVRPKSRVPREGLFWLLAALLLFLTGLFKGINLLVLLAYLLGGLWALNHWILRVSMRGIRGRRIPTGPIFAGDAVECSIEISCTGKRPVRGIVVVDRGDGRNRKWLVLSLKPNAPLRIQRQETFPNRGRYAAAALRAYSSFPFGLTLRSVDLSDREDWIILPRLGHVNVDQMRQWLARVLRGDGRTRRRQLLPVAMEADIHGLRDFRPGDSPRWIHWRTSARRNQLLVREFEDSSQPQIVVIVEPWLPAEPTHADRERLEALISLAGTIVREWCREPSARLTLIVMADNPTILENGTGSDFVLHALELLAVEKGRSAANDFSCLQVVNRNVRGAPIMVISSKTDSVLADSICCELGRPVAQINASQLPSWYALPGLNSGS